SWKDTADNYLSSVQQLYHTPEQTMDVVFAGSSHCYCSIYPEYLWRDYGYAAFDMAVSGQDKSANYYSLLELLKTQSPKVIFVEAYALLYDGYSQEGNAYRNLLSMKNSVNSIRLIREAVAEEKQMDYLLRWPVVHTRYAELTRYDFVQYAPSEYGRGANWGWKQGAGAWPEAAKTYMDAAPLSEENLRWLDRILALGDENDIDIVFYVAPMQVYNGEQAVYNGAAEYVTAAGAKWIDCNKLFDEMGISAETDFEDGYHCNAYGAEKVTSYMGRYLQENYELEDHRGDTAYTVWDQSLRLYQHCEAAQGLDQLDMESYLQTVAGLEDVKLILALEGDYKNSTLPMDQYAAWLGIPPEQYEAGGKWVVSQGEVEVFLDNASMEIVCVELSGGDFLKLENLSLKTGESVLNNIRINEEYYGKALNGLTVIVYDPLREMIISSRGIA
ncbi:MAG: hypothetical protein K2O34_11255, partial [Acetatifactor sp.]|nr:hypothetical protein [Acetatifactor sp.]